MTSFQVQNVLDLLRVFFGKLSDRFSSARADAENEQMSSLLETIAQREKDIESRLARFEEESHDKELLETWLQINVDETLNHILDELQLDPGMSPSEVITQALIVDNKLIDLYRDLASETSISHVVEFFEELAKSQDGQTRRLARSVRFD